MVIVFIPCFLKPKSNLEKQISQVRNVPKTLDPNSLGICAINLYMSWSLTVTDKKKSSLFLIIFTSVFFPTTVSRLLITEYWFCSWSPLQRDLDDCRRSTMRWQSVICCSVLSLLEPVLKQEGKPLYIISGTQDLHTDVTIRSQRVRALPNAARVNTALTTQSGGVSRSNIFSLRVVYRQKES